MIVSEFERFERYMFFEAMHVSSWRIQYDAFFGEHGDAGSSNKIRDNKMPYIPNDISVNPIPKRNF